MTIFHTTLRILNEIPKLGKLIFYSFQRIRIKAQMTIFQRKYGHFSCRKLGIAQIIQIFPPLVAMPQHFYIHTFRRVTFALFYI